MYLRGWVKLNFSIKERLKLIFVFVGNFAIVRLFLSMLWRLKSNNYFDSSDQLQLIWLFFFQYSDFARVVCTFLFTCWFWYSCVKKRLDGRVLWKNNIIISNGIQFCRLTYTQLEVFILRILKILVNIKNVLRVLF